MVTAVSQVVIDQFQLFEEMISAHKRLTECDDDLGASLLPLFVETVTFVGHLPQAKIQLHDFLVGVIHLRSIETR